MANRRDVMKGGMALAAIAAAPPALSRGSVASNALPAATTIVIADRALPETASFAAAAAAHGYRVREFDRDVGALWINVIELRLRTGPLALLGITSAATLFCLETLARDYGARTVVRIGETTSRAQGLDGDPSFARLFATEPGAALPPFPHVHAPGPSPYSLAWRIETHPRFRSVLGPRVGRDSRLEELTGTAGNNPFEIRG